MKVFAELVEHRQQIQVKIQLKHLNYYAKREEMLSDIEHIQSRYAEMTKEGARAITMKASSKAFPIVDIKGFEAGEKVQLNGSFSFHHKIFDPTCQDTTASGLHREVLGSMMLMNGSSSFDEYKARSYTAELLAGES